jgi:beta-glucanase (GH16 family)
VKARPSPFACHADSPRDRTGLNQNTKKYDNSISFYVDGEPMQEFEGGLPEKRMKLYVNTWFPTWLDGEEPDSDRYAYMDWIER